MRFIRTYDMCWAFLSSCFTIWNMYAPVSLLFSNLFLTCLCITVNELTFAKEIKIFGINYNVSCKILLYCFKKHCFCFLQNKICFFIFCAHTLSRKRFEHILLTSKHIEILYAIFIHFHGKTYCWLSLLMAQQLVSLRIY